MYTARSGTAAGKAKPAKRDHGPPRQLLQPTNPSTGELDPKGGSTPANPCHGDDNALPTGPRWRLDSAPPGSFSRPNSAQAPAFFSPLKLAAAQRSVFVANVPNDATEEALERIFSQFGAVSYASIRRSRFIDSGYAFVFFHELASVAAALAHRDEPLVYGRQVLTVKPRIEKGRLPANCAALPARVGSAKLYAGAKAPSSDPTGTSVSQDEETEPAPAIPVSASYPEPQSPELSTDLSDIVIFAGDDDDSAVPYIEEQPEYKRPVIVGDIIPDEYSNAVDSSTSSSTLADQPRATENPLTEIVVPYLHPALIIDELPGVVLRIVGVPPSWTPQTVYNIFSVYGMVHATFTCNDKDEDGRRQAFVQMAWQEVARRLCTNVRILVVHQAMLHIYPTDFINISHALAIGEAPVEDSAALISSSVAGQALEIAPPMPLPSVTAVHSGTLASPAAPYALWPAPIPMHPYADPGVIPAHPPFVPLTGPPPRDYLARVQTASPVPVRRRTVDTGRNYGGSPGRHAVENTFDNRRIFVSNLDPQLFCSEDDLRKLFAPLGSVVSTQLRQPRRLGNPLFGYVTFANAKVAEMAVQTMNRKMIGDLTIRVSYTMSSGRPISGRHPAAHNRLAGGMTAV